MILTLSIIQYANIFIEETMVVWSTEIKLDEGYINS